MNRQPFFLMLLFSLGSLPVSTILASSHREAPLITEMPKVDGTDFYMFSSYEPGRSGYITLIANYQPLQDAYGGPNYFSMDPDALYEIQIDNNGDAIEDLSFQFRFSQRLRNQQLQIGDRKVATPLINVGPPRQGLSAGLNLVEKYTVTLLRGDHRTGTRRPLVNSQTGSAVFEKPVDNIGEKTIADYASYAQRHQYEVNIPGCAKTGRLFVGQRKDPFAVNLGEIFDLINTDPLAAVNAESNTIDDKNVSSLILEVATECLTVGEPVIGAWTTASLRRSRVLRYFPGFTNDTRESGNWVQVSRLGMPLVNELVIGLKDKNLFNVSRPETDANRFSDYVTHPTLPALIEILFPSAPAPTRFPRQDLIATFLTGIAGINQPRRVHASEMLRLNTATEATVMGSQHALGVLGGDAAGFPNGRRPGDDVVDITLRVAMGVLCSLNDADRFGCSPDDAPAGALPFTDGVAIDDRDFDGRFPYLLNPVSGSPAP